MVQQKEKNSLVRIEQELGEARAAIRKAIERRNFTITSEIEDFVPKGCVYRNAFAFHQLSNYTYIHTLLVNLIKLLISYICFYCFIKIIVVIVDLFLIFKKIMSRLILIFFFLLLMKR